MLSEFRRVLYAFFAAMLCGPASAGVPPIGYLDNINPLTKQLDGWTIDPDTSTPISVHIYKDGSFITDGSLISAISASSYRPDVGNHAFFYPLPASVVDGKPHSLYGYGIDATGDANTLLGNSPKLLLGETSQVWLGWKKDIWTLPASTNAEFFKKHIDVLQIFNITWWDSDPIYGDPLNQFNAGTDAQMLDFIAMQADTGIKLAVETPGFDARTAPNCGSHPGYDDFPRDLAGVQRFLALGGVIDYIVYPGSVGNLLHPNNTASSCYTVDTAVDELVLSMQRWRNVLPNVKFIYTITTPGLGWKGQQSYLDSSSYGLFDANVILKTITQKTALAGIPISGVHVDCPYEYITGEEPQTSLLAPTYAPVIDPLARLRDLEKEVKNDPYIANLRFGPIFNSPWGGEYPIPSAANYHIRTLAYISLFEAAGGAPDSYVLESWYKQHPDSLGPESTPYTFSNLANHVIDRVRRWPVDNYSFEFPSMTAPYYAYTPYTGSWTFSGSAGIAKTGSDFCFSSCTVIDGEQAAFVQGWGYVSLPLTNLQPNTEYSVSFFVSRRTGFGLANYQTLEVKIDGVSLGQVTPASGDWESFVSDRFPGSTGTHTLTIIGLNPLGGDNTALVDDVRLVPHTD